MFFRIGVLVLTIFGASIVSGCGGGAPDRPAVHKAGGIIKLNGTPVADATVQFVPAKGRPATGKTDAKGEFSLTTYNTNDGAIEGSHTVTVSAPLPANIVSNTPGELQAIEKANAAVPAKYNDAKSSGLTNTVEKGGKNFFEIDLKP